MLYHIIIISLFCNGLYVITRPGMLFDFVRHGLEEYTLHHHWFVPLYKPLLGCIRCMASVWGIAVSLLLLPLGFYMLWYVPVCCICAAALNSVIYQMYE